MPSSHSFTNPEGQGFTSVIVKELNSVSVSKQLAVLCISCIKMKPDLHFADLAAERG